MKATFKYVFFLSLLMKSLIAFSQTQINTSGGKATGTNGNVEFSVSGITEIRANGTNGYIITGVQQPQEISILPITLLSFEATLLKSNYVKLNWSTVYEYNNAFFTVEKSANGFEFSPIVNIKSLGNNNNSNQNYTYLDSILTNSITYYRLKQVDVNGKFTYSKIIAITIKEQVEIKTFPNPTQSILNLVCTDFENKKLTYQIVNIKGEILETNLIKSNVTVVQLANKPVGLYIIQLLKNNQLIQSFKIIKN